MTSIRQMKRRHKKVLRRHFGEKASKVTCSFGDETIKFLAVVGSNRKCRVILTRSYLRRVLEVQKTKKLEAKKGGEV